MEAKELRIGNYIFGDTGLILKVTGETITSIEQFGVKVSGTPITEEWLLKFGFEKLTNNPTFAITLIKSRLKKLVIYRYENEWLLAFLDYYSLTEKAELLPTEIQYVHQLQNLYFALTGNDFIINQPELAKKPRQNKYNEKLKIHGTLDEVLKISVEHAKSKKK